MQSLTGTGLVGSGFPEGRREVPGTVVFGLGRRFGRGFWTGNGFEAVSSGFFFSTYA